MDTTTTTTSTTTRNKYPPRDTTICKWWLNVELILFVSHWQAHCLVNTSTFGRRLRSSSFKHVLYDTKKVLSAWYFKRKHKRFQHETSLARVMDVTDRPPAKQRLDSRDTNPKSQTEPEARRRGMEKP